MFKHFHTIIFITLLLGFSLITFHSQAQSYYGYPQRDLSMGLTINPNIGWMRYDDDRYSSEAKVGYSYGLLADIGFAPNYYFSTGFMINTLESSLNSGSHSEIAARDYRLQYAEVPIAIKLKTNENQYGRFYGQFGFTAGVKVSGKEKYEDANSYSKIDGDAIVRLGLQIGAGAEWRISNSLHFLTGISYNNGFTEALKEGSPKLSYLGLQFGLLF